MHIGIIFPTMHEFNSIKFISLTFAVCRGQGLQKVPAELIKIVQAFGITRKTVFRIYSCYVNIFLNVSLIKASSEIY